MDAILMHKEMPVVDVEIDEASGVILGIGAVHNRKHLPIGIPVQGGHVDRSELNAWWAERSIPASRSGIREALEQLGILSMILSILLYTFFSRIFDLSRF